MKSTPFKGVAVAAAVSAAALAFAPTKAQARHDDLPAIIAGIAIGAIIAHQVGKRHRHHYGYYRDYPHHYGPPRHGRAYHHSYGKRHWKRRHDHRHH